MTSSRIVLVLSCVIVRFAVAQLDAFALPQAQRYAPKPTITPDIQQYFELDGHAKELVDTLIGPRPGGFFPEKTYEVAAPPITSAGGGQGGQPNGLAAIESAFERFFSGPPAGNSEYQLPPGFNQGFSLNNGNKPITSFQENSQPSIEGKEGPDVRKAPQKSSISGIPSDYPKLPKFPMTSVNEPVRQPVIMRNTPEIPKFASKPEVPEELSSTAADASEYGTLTDEPHAPGGLIGTVIDLFMNKDKAPDANGIGKSITNLLGGSNSPLPAKNMISNVLYKALTSGSVQSNSTDLPMLDFNSSTPITLTAAQQAAIGENLEMIQNLIAQPSSPLCNPKPVPVTEFNMDAFMGQWYQVVYSPVVSASPCSIVSYKKLADINNGGIGSIFEIFEYTSDGTPYSKPKITSGYAILKQMGELIFRTTAHQEDVSVHVVATGPINANGEYDFAILTTNCNYPVYVFARDPVVYKQRYEVGVNQILEQKGIVSGFSKLLNIVAPVDASTCTFPPTLFNFRG
ncbi:CRE-LPR-5 protein [Aphelenchoides avenae]|nr:CRE-LPR-5 protein [Aphelenchus avenae]